LSYFASTVRLKKILERLGLTEEKMETLIEEINAHCFRQEKSEKEFVLKIDEVFDIAADLNTSIWDINSKINQKTTQIKELDKKIADKQEDLRMVVERYGTTVDDLEDFRLNRPLRVKIVALENSLQSHRVEIDRLEKEAQSYKILQEIEKNNSRSVLEKEFEEANKKLPEDEPLDILELARLTDEVYFNPSRNVEIINLMRQFYPNESKERTSNLKDR
jgi:hypothetical protein